MFRSPIVKKSVNSNFLQQHLLIDSSDNVGMHPNPELLLDFNIGAPRCDNRFAYVMAYEFNYNILNPAFAVHAIEFDQRKRVAGVYGMAGAVVGDGHNVLLSSRSSIVF